MYKLIQQKIVGILSIAAKESRKLLGTALVLAAVAGWWGVLYPQLSLNQDTYRIVSEDGTVQDGDTKAEWENSDTIYMEILNAESGRVRFRSRLFDYATELYKHLCGV